jgi:hypothetical protein
MPPATDFIMTIRALQAGHASLTRTAFRSRLPRTGAAFGRRAEVPRCARGPTTTAALVSRRLLAGRERRCRPPRGHPAGSHEWRPRRSSNRSSRRVRGCAAAGIEAPRAGPVRVPRSARRRGAVVDLGPDRPRGSARAGVLWQVLAQVVSVRIRFDLARREEHLRRPPPRVPVENRLDRPRSAARVVAGMVHPSAVGGRAVDGCQQDLTPPQILREILLGPCPLFPPQYSYGFS